jgi:Tfp pilus assembly protein PilN
MVLQSASEGTGKIIAKTSKRAAILKRDINLLPANEYSEKIARTGTTILAVFISVLLLAYFAIVMPTLKLNDLQAEALGAQNQLASVQTAAGEFDSLISQRNSLQQMIDSLSQSEKAYLQPADVMAQLSQACPNSISLTSITLNGSGMTIAGRALSDRDIAQFIVNLKSIPEFKQIALMSVREDVETAGTMQNHVFEVNAGLPPTESPAPAASAAPADSTKGGDGK